MLMKIIVPIFSTSCQNKTFDLLTEVNPGVGGTTHVAILLAARLSKRLSSCTIELANYSYIDLTHAPANLHQHTYSSIDSFFLAFTAAKYPTACIIATAAQLKGVSSDLLDRISSSTYCWIHHPFFWNKKLKDAAFLGYICIGDYQYFSNRFFYPRCSLIQNILPPNNLSSVDPLTFADKVTILQSGHLSFVHLGALVRAKGFWLIAKQWTKIKSFYPHSSLHIIGSASTYAADVEHHPLIPCEHDYANEILKYIPMSDIETGKVVFHGNLGLDKLKILQNATIALLNPTGMTEAFPASPLECMAVGTPVIASSGFGMFDSMRYFPRLSLHKPEDIVSKINILASDPNYYKRVCIKSIATARKFSNRSNMSVDKWVDLIASGGKKLKKVDLSNYLDTYLMIFRVA